MKNEEKQGKQPKKYSLVDENGTILFEFDEGKVVLNSNENIFVDFSLEESEHEKKKFLKLYWDNVSRFFKLRDPFYGYLLENISQNGFFQKSIEDICAGTGLTKNTVKKAIKDFIEMDAMQLFKKASKGHPAIYLINPDFVSYGADICAKKQYCIYQSLKKQKKSTI